MCFPRPCISPFSSRFIGERTGRHYLVRSAPEFLLGSRCTLLVWEDLPACSHRLPITWRFVPSAGSYRPEAIAPHFCRIHSDWCPDIADASPPRSSWTNCCSLVQILRRSRYGTRYGTGCLVVLLPVPRAAGIWPSRVECVALLQIKSPCTIGAGSRGGSEAPNRCPR